MSTVWHPSVLEGAKLLVVLQNAWAKGGLANGWNPAVWRREFLSSRSATRLRVVFRPGELETLNYCNAAPGIAAVSDGVLKGNPRHVQRAIRRVEPVLILACGKVAEETVRHVWDGNLLAIPHPTFRPLTNALLEEAREILVKKLIYDKYPTWRNRSFFPERLELLEGTLRLALRQRKGCFETERLPLEPCPF